MKIIGAGFGRTGTTSLKAALEQLGFDPCYHMVEVFKNPRHAEFWHRAALTTKQGDVVDWDELLGGYEATVDWPGSYFWEELMEAYPEAKVLLSVRDPDKWYESTLRTIYGMRKSDYVFGVLSWMPVIGNVARMIDTLIWKDTFESNFEDRAYAKEVFERHIREVREKVPADKLLVYEVKQGWEPLCEFLDVEVPGEAFPHLNDAASARRAIRIVTTIAYAAPLVGTVLAGVTLLKILRRVRRSE